MLELNKIYQGNCAELLPKLDDNSIDLTVTSPPYDDLREYNGYVFDLDTFKIIAKELYRVTKKGGVVVWVVGDATKNGSETGTSFRQALYFMECGFNLHDTMIYAKNSYMPMTHNRYEQAFEYMFVFSKGSLKTWNPIKIYSKTAGTKRYRGGSKQAEATYAERKREERTTVNSQKQHPNIFYYDVGKNEKTIHNAPFPEQLSHDHIISWSNEGDTVLDPFMGSGTTAKMAYETNRQFIGFEISAKYIEIANKRLSQKNLFNQFV